MAAILSRPQCVKKWLCYSGHRVALVVHRAQKSVPDSAGEWPTFLPPPLESCSGTANADGPNSQETIIHSQQRPIIQAINKNTVEKNGKQCMMQMPVKTTLRLYCDNSHLVPSACEIINVLRHSRLVIVDCLLNRHYKKKSHESEWWKWKPHCDYTVMTVTLFRVCEIINVLRHSYGRLFIKPRL